MNLDDCFKRAMSEVKPEGRSKLVKHMMGACVCGWELPLFVTVYMTPRVEPRPVMQGYVFACPKCDRRVVKEAAP